MGLDQPLHDGQAQPRPGGPAVGLRDAVEQVEDALALGLRDAGPLVDDGDLGHLAVDPRGDRDRRADRRVFRRVLDDVGDGLADQDRIDMERRQIARRLDDEAVAGEHALEVVAHDAENLPQIDRVPPWRQRTMAEPGHVEQVLDVTVEPSRLVERRQRQLAAAASVETVAGLGQARDRADHRDQRGAQVMADRVQQRAAQLLALGRDAGVCQVFGEPGAFDGDRDLVLDGDQQPPRLRVEPAQAVPEPDADDAEGRPGRGERDKQPFAHRQRRRAGAGGLVLLEGPARSALRPRVELVDRGMALDLLQRAARIGHEDQRLAVQRGGDVEGGRPQHVVGVLGRGDLAGEVIERRGSPLRDAHRLHLRLQPARQAAGEDGAKR